MSHEAAFKSLMSVPECLLMLRGLELFHQVRRDLNLCRSGPRCKTRCQGCSRSSEVEHHHRHANRGQRTGPRRAGSVAYAIESELDVRDSISIRLLRQITVIDAGSVAHHLLKFRQILEQFDVIRSPL